MGDDFRRDIAWAGTAACLFEAVAPKAGNVNRRYDFADCRLEDFLLSAAAIGEPLGTVGRHGVGETVLAAITATRRLTNTNTNLGIVLLLAPLAKAWERAVPAERGDLPPAVAERHGQRAALARELDKVLASLSAADTRLVYAAIRLAAPAGMGHPETGDVYGEDPPAMTLLAAMRLAAERDLIACQYADGFRAVLATGVPALEQALGRGLPLPQAIAHSQLYLLSLFPDTLIARKAGRAASEEVRARARAVWAEGGWCSPSGQAAAAEFDRWLRRGGHGLNPGTTADLVTAAIFVLCLENGPALWRRAWPADKSAGAAGREGEERG